MLVLGPNTLDEALAAAQRYESNHKVLSKGSAHVLSSTSEEMDENSTSHLGDSRTPRMGSAALSTTSKNFRETEEHPSRKAR